MWERKTTHENIFEIAKMMEICFKRAVVMEICPGGFPSRVPERRDGSVNEIRFDSRRLHGCMRSVNERVGMCCRCLLLIRTKQDLVAQQVCAFCCFRLQLVCARSNPAFVISLRQCCGFGVANGNSPAAAEPSR
jgi:hypothetical protein